ncbi:Lipoma-preferred partner [Galemys pyrenaicus]|uniref:Lipoma-preferred partner n=1 Tax=Galemys pyrenaicus TaxID=202257 RepID=A0A8J6DNB1_GALPY|nr:Lipoma-preferred partner [Galemys pyrenaicus]
MSQCSIRQVALKTAAVAEQPNKWLHPWSTVRCLALGCHHLCQAITAAKRGTVSVAQLIARPPGFSALSLTARGLYLQRSTATFWKIGAIPTMSHPSWLPPKSTGESLGHVPARMETTHSFGTPSISVSTQQPPKKFAPVVAPKPKYNPYKQAGGEEIGGLSTVPGMEEDRFLSYDTSWCFDLPTFSLIIHSYIVPNAVVSNRMDIE